LVVGREPRMKPLGGVAVRVDTWIVRGEGFHLVKAVLDWIGIGFVAQMPLPREVRRIAVLVEELRDGRRLFAQCVLVAWRNDNWERRANREAPGHQGGATRRAAGLSVPAREHRAFLCDLVDVRRWMTQSGTAA